MTVSGRNETIANGSSRPESAIQARSRECPFPDRKHDIAQEVMIVRRSNRLDCPLSPI